MKPSKFPTHSRLPLSTFFPFLPRSDVERYIFLPLKRLLRYEKVVQLKVSLQDLHLLVDRGVEVIHVKLILLHLLVGFPFFSLLFSPLIFKP